MARAAALATLALGASLAACTPSQEAAPPQTTIGAPDGAATASSAPPSASAAAERLRAMDAALRCRQERCANLGKACFDNCYRHGHPRDPEGHTRCNESCRASSGLGTCEDACEREVGLKRTP
jgi:hypothetical protein